MSQDFKIIIACRNVEKWISYSVESLLRQKYENWTGVVIDDCSIDKTYNILSSLLSGSSKITLVRNSQRRKLLYNTIIGVKILDPCDEDVIVFLDGDDWLSDSDVLSYLADVYIDDKIWITWGNYVNDSGQNPDLSMDYSKASRGVWAKEAPKDWNIRKDWRYSHLKTCKYFLWKNIKDSSFRLETTGKYFPSATDHATMYPMIEMAGQEHCKFISRILYVYNVGNPQSWVNPKLISINKDCAATVRNRKPYAQKTKEELLIGNVIV